MDLFTVFQNPINNGGEAIHGITSQINALQLSSPTPNSTNGVTGSNTYSTHHDQQYSIAAGSTTYSTHHDQQYPIAAPPGQTGSTNGTPHVTPQIPPNHTAQYTQQPPGWTIRLSHTPHFLQQVCVYVLYGILEFDILCAIIILGG